MIAKSKKYYFQKKLISNKKYLPIEAIQLIKNITTIYPQTLFKFDQSINLSFHFSKIVLTKINAAKFKLYANLPYSTGKTMLIGIVKPREIKTNNFDIKSNIKIYDEIELISNLENKLINFDILYIPKERSKNFLKYKKILESKGIILSDLHKTLFETDNFNTFVSELNPFLNKYSVDKGGNLHGLVGKSSFSIEHLYSNLVNLIKLIKSHEILGNFIEKITLNATMSPSIKLDLTQI